MGPTEKAALKKLTDGTLITTMELAETVWPAKLPEEPKKQAANIIARLRKKGYKIEMKRGYVLK